ncbi:MAG: YdcF family protein [Chlorobiaceae bacterium]|nr:YdcF family protein [Chlorobiaceae bacterium]
MLILNKILPLLVLPPGICLVLVAVGLLWRRKGLAWAGVFLLFVLSVPVVGDSLMRGVEWPYDRIPVNRVRRADAVVVLSGMIEHTKGAPLGEWGEAADRFEGGLDLFRAGKAPLLVFTYGQLPWQKGMAPEGELLAKRAMSLGIPAKSIRLTGQGGNTAEEAVEVARLFGIGKGSGKKIILVTSAFHMRRAAMLFTRAGFLVDPYPVDFRTAEGKRPTILSLLPDAEAMDESATAIREVIGTGFYLATGWLGR